jgi:hypothetical protein
MTTETHGSLSYRATTPLGLEADEISFAITRFLPKAEMSEEFAYIYALEARYLQLTGQQWCGPA